MTRPHLNNLLQHPLGQIDPLPAPLDRNLTILPRLHVLIHLNVAPRALLQVVDGRALGADDASHVHLGAGEVFGSSAAHGSAGTIGTAGRPVLTTAVG